jgi:hypothetical protein
MLYYAIVLIIAGAQPVLVGYANSAAECKASAQSAIVYSERGAYDGQTVACVQVRGRVAQ